MTEAGMYGAARAVLVRDLRLLWRRRSDTAQPLVFVLLVVTMFPLALGADPVALAAVAPAVLWIAVLLAGLLSLDGLYRSDHDDGSLEQMLLSPVPLALLMAVRIFVHWLGTAVPILLLAPLLAEMMYLPRNLLPVLMVTLAIGTPLLSLIGGVLAALTVGLRRSGMLMGLLALPLYVPVVVFGAGSVMAASHGQPWEAALILLAAGLVLALVLAPIAAAAALRITLT